MTKSKNKYLFCFGLGFGLMLFILLSDLIQHGGILYYTGDYNQQVLPFYFNLHENIRNGNFLWDWYSGLGNNQIAAYSYYNLSSPFFWLSMLFPAKWLVYLMPVFWCAKFGIATVTAYAYIKQYVKTENYAVTGALLYSFSTFMAYNTVYHFVEVFAFFPLLLLATDQLINNNRKGYFAVMVGFMALLNYYFFFGQVIFVIIYFVIKCLCRSYKITWKKFFQLAFEAVCGVLIAMIVLLPTLDVLLNTSRLQPAMDWRSLFLYETGFQRYGKIIQSMFTLPDFFAYSNFFMDYSDTYPRAGSLASIALYLPLFSMTGVISFIWAKKKHWASVLLTSSLVIAFVPCLNNMFSGFSPNYYARWLYMPILIMAMVTAYILENSEEISLKPGLITCGIVTLGLAVMFIFYNLLEIYRWDFANFDTDRFYGWYALGLSAVSLIIVYLIFYKMKRDKEFSAKVLAFTCIGILFSSGFMVMYGLTAIKDKDGDIDKSQIAEYLPFGDLEGDEFYRIQTDKRVRNFSAMWRHMNIDQFNSIYEPAIEDFYQTIGMKYSIVNVKDNPDQIYPVVSLVSGKYYIAYKDFPAVWTDDMYTAITEGTHLVKTKGNYYVFENENFIPMGFTYDYAITQEQLEQFPAEDRAFIMLKALCLEENDLLPAASAEILKDTSYEAYTEDCKNRSKLTASEFETAKNGFTAEITLPEENYVFFSVPFDKGFSATLDGNVPLEIKRANVGFMAVKVPAGTHSIEFSYVPAGFRLGLILSIAGILVLTAYLILPKVIKKH